MKLPITDQFLYDLLYLLKETAHVAESFIGPRRSLLKVLPYNQNPVFERYRRERNANDLRKIIYY